MYLSILGGFCVDTVSTARAAEKMPEYTFTNDEGEPMTIDSSTGIATFKGMRYYEPCTLEAENGQSFMKLVPLTLLVTIDFNRIQAIHTFHDEEAMHIRLGSWNDLYLLKMPFATATSTVGGKRCS